ncbi:hypothetical protein IAT38_002777 [Cryptococcus sp. DSM 104549]
MSSAKSLKRKASSTKVAGKKRGPAVRQPSPSPSAASDAGFEDLEDGSAGDSVGDDAGVFLDPMIDPQGSSDEDDSEDDEDDEEAAEPAAGPSRSQPSKSLYKAPTLSEMEALRNAKETGGTTFSLQLSELLSSTLHSTTPHPALKDLLSAIHSTLLALPTLPGLTPAKAAKRLGAVKVPFVGLEEYSPVGKGKDVNWTLGWEKPAEILVGGSWGVVGGYKKGKGEMGGVDLVVVMPTSIFTPKDRLDYRYFYKRAHYLAVIFSELKRLSEKKGNMKGIEVEWTTAMGDERRPIVTLAAGKEQGLKSHVNIRIHASAPTGLFPISSLSPLKSLVRTSTSSDEPSSIPTPLYATSIMHDTLHKSHLLHLHRLSQLLTPERTTASYLAMWRIWAARRGIRVERGGSGWFAGLVLGWVVDGSMIGGAGGKREKVKKVAGLGKGLGHWGALRAAWEFLAHTNFNDTPVFMSTSDSGLPQHDFLHAFKNVLVDPTGRVNLFAEWEEGEVQLLRHHARETLGMLEDESVDRFADVFLKDQSLGPEVFDEYLQIDISTAKIEGDVIQRSERPSTASLATASIAATLRRGLSDRAKLVHVSPLSPTSLSIGIMFNPDHATRVLDIGPSSDRPAEAEAFRTLWGERAELRRFKDGNIAESVVWDLTRPEEATLIPGRIVRWLLQRHFEVTGDDVVSLSASPEWLAIVQTPASARDAVSLAGSEKQGFRPTMAAYDALYRLLKDIDDQLPLSVLNVSPASEMLRYASTFVPHPVDVNRLPSAPECISYVPYAEVVVQFESSAKWPDDLAAVQKVKLALFEKLTRVITSQMPAAAVGVVFDAGCSEIEDQAALEVLLPAGVAFRLRIHHEKERGLLERIIHDDTPLFATSLPRPPRRLAIPALASHLLRFHHLPQHHSSIAPLHHRFPSYSSATRLLKRWFAAHMLSSHVGPEVLELVMAKVYLESGALQRPASAVSGFLRAIELLARWDWKTEPLFVPIFSASGRDEETGLTTNNEPASGRVRFPAEARGEGVKAFERLRAKEKGAGAEAAVHAWVVITEEDEEGSRWTKGISRAVAGRVGVLAKATLGAVKNAVAEGGLDVNSLFTTPLAHFDFIIHLHPSVLPRSSQSLTASPSLWEAHLKFRNLAPDASDEIRVGFDPAESFVRDLQRIYGDALLVFWDQYGGSVVGGIWNPGKDAGRGLKAFLGYSSMPVESEAALVTINKDAVMGEIARLGKGLIEKIERRR